METCQGNSLILTMIEAVLTEEFLASVSCSLLPPCVWHTHTITQKKSTLEMHSKSGFCQFSNGNINEICILGIKNIDLENKKAAIKTAYFEV